jgi:hypothetical protein
MSEAIAFRPERRDWAHAGALAALLLLLYAASSPRSVALEDDGLFALSSAFLGIEHPPGYPLHTLLGHLFTLLPIGSAAYRVHMLSAVFGALSCGLLWMCARSLRAGPVAAWLAALGLGLTPVFWSQSVIAEVYTLNAFFFVLLLWLGLRAGAGTLYWMALVFGLSLSNHWPLMGLVTPAFLILLWPLRAEFVKRLGVLSWLAIVGLAPYAWMIYRSWRALPISFYGPLETLPEIWFFLSRAGYAGIDQSPTGGWIDRIRFLQFMGGQLLLQFAVAGTLLAVAGFAAQWRALGRRVASFLTVAFLMPSVGLILLLGFDYDYLSRHVFHVYPLPSYAVAALWMALGLEWLVQRFSLRPPHRAAAAGIVLALIAAAGAWVNFDPNEDWAARYARMVLKTLPRDAVVFPQGDTDLPPIAYLHLIENERPDLTLYEAKGLILGNRLFHLLRVSDAEAQARLKAFIAAERRPVVTTMVPFEGYARRDRWLHAEIDRTAREPSSVKIEIPEEAVEFFEREVMIDRAPRNAWVAYHHNELRFRYAVLLARRLVPGQALDERTRRQLAALEKDPYGALGLAEGLMANPAGYSAPAVASLLQTVSERMRPDEMKMYRAKYFYVRAALRLGNGDRAGALEDLGTSGAIWPARANPALKALENVRAAGR